MHLLAARSNADNCFKTEEACCGLLAVKMRAFRADADARQGQPRGGPTTSTANGCSFASARDTLPVDMVRRMPEGSTVWN